MKYPVRVRYAPSPTGEPHIGNVRTALFNWLFARRYGGKFIVRIEDTDQERSVSGVVERILDSLRWLGIDWDEGPDIGGAHASYMQSQRLPIYHDITQRLIDGGLAYSCYCSRERLDQVRKDRARQGLPHGYDRHCRDLTSDQRLQLERANDSPVARFKMPFEGETTVHDLIRNEVTWQNGLQDDFIILKSDGFPTYHLANVVDDHMMEITHVMRAEEWLPSTPRHLHLYQALGYDPPLFAHLPMILGPDRSKLSKRHGATALLEYRDAGYLPEAMVNFMAFLGWSLDDKTDIISATDLVGNFSVDRVGKAGAIFDIEKLQWMNGMYIRGLAPEDLAQRALPFLQKDLSSSSMLMDSQYLCRVMSLVQERIKTLKEVPESTAYFFSEDLADTPNDIVQKGMDREAALAALQRTEDELAVLELLEAEPLEERLRAAGEELGLSPRQYFGVVRVAVTGRSASPPLFQTMEVLGKERCMRRIRSAIRLLASA